MSRDRAENRLQRRAARRRDDRLLLDSLEDVKPMRVRRAEREIKPLTKAQAAYDQSISANTLTISTGVWGTGKAQPLDALIKTPGGWTRMGDLTPGSKITAVDGSVTEVVSVHPQGAKDIYRITFEDGRQTECCDDHLWRVYYYPWGRSKKDGNSVDLRWRVIPLSKIRKLLLDTKSKSYAFSIELPKPESQVDIHLPIDPYLLGLLIGDGHFGRTDLRLTTSDQFIVDQVSSLLPVEMTIRHLKGYDYGLIRRDIYGSNGNPIMLVARDLGLHQSRCNSKRVPEIYMGGSPGQRLAILQGLMDADGTVDKCGSVSFNTVSEKLATDVRDIVRSLGGIAYISPKRGSYTYKGERKEGKTSFNVRIRISDPRSLFRLPRKLDRLSENYQYADLRLRIVSVEYVGKKVAQCISVAHPSHLYITDDYIVTHNTWWAAMRAAKAFEAGEVERIIVTRPAVGADEELGFFPGDLDEKFAPHWRPVRDALEEFLGSGPVEYHLKTKQIEARPLGLLRGATFSNAFIIFDEAQNSTPRQMKLFLSRIGEGCRVVVDGDFAEQQDIEGLSGLEDALTRLKGQPDVGHVHFEVEDIVRSGFARMIAVAYSV